MLPSFQVNYNQLITDYTDHTDDTVNPLLFSVWAASSVSTVFRQL
jgi:hypothetical protein